MHIDMWFLETREGDDDSMTSARVCGVPAIAPRLMTLSEAKIVGGTEAVPHSWPWQVHILSARQTITLLASAASVYMQHSNEPAA